MKWVQNGIRHRWTCEAALLHSLVSCTVESKMYLKRWFIVSKLNARMSSGVWVNLLGVKSFTAFSNRGLINL